MTHVLSSMKIFQNISLTIKTNFSIKTSSVGFQYVFLKKCFGNHKWKSFYYLVAEIETKRRIIIFIYVYILIYIFTDRKSFSIFFPHRWEFLIEHHRWESAETLPKLTFSKWTTELTSKLKKSSAEQSKVWDEVSLLVATPNKHTASKQVETLKVKENDKRRKREREWMEEWTKVFPNSISSLSRAITPELLNKLATDVKPQVGRK